MEKGGMKVTRRQNILFKVNDERSLSLIVVGPFQVLLVLDS